MAADKPELRDANDIQNLLAQTISDNKTFIHDSYYMAEEIMDAFNDAGYPLTRLIRPAGGGPR